MDRSTVARVARTLGYLVVGAAGTALVAVALLSLTQPVQSLVYGVFYLQVGPSEATEAAILLHVLAASALALAVPTLAGDYLSDRLANRGALLRVLGVLMGLLGLFVIVALARLASFLTAFVVVGLALLAIPLVVRYRYGVRSGALPAFVGGVPVVLLVVLLAGFGIGWGWGYVVTAREVPAPAGNATVEADFGAVPEVQADLFAAGHCESDTAGRQVCRLALRGYDQEVRAVRFLAAHGLRCPYLNAPSPREPPEVLARADGRYVRVRCISHGD